MFGQLKILRFHAENLRLACYGIISAAGNMVTAVMRAAALFFVRQEPENGVSPSFSRGSNFTSVARAGLSKCTRMPALLWKPVSVRWYDRSKSFHWQSEKIANAAFGLDDRRLIWTFEFPP
jgi:hypothetical protein